MAITQALCTSAKAEFLGGVHDLDTDTLKIALYYDTATLGPATTLYSDAGEVVGEGYLPGGLVLTGVSINTVGTAAVLDFADPTWASSTITARGALIYNASKSNRALAVIDLGADKTSTDGNFTILLPEPTATTAVLRIE